MAEDFHYYEPTARIHSWRVLAFFAVAIKGEREANTGGTAGRKWSQQKHDYYHKNGSDLDTRTLINGMKLR